MVANLSRGTNSACHFRNEIGNAFILVLWVRHIYFFHFNLYLVDCVFPLNLNPCPWSPCSAFDLREFTFSHYYAQLYWFSFFCPSLLLVLPLAHICILVQLILFCFQISTRITRSKFCSSKKEKYCCHLWAYFLCLAFEDHEALLVEKGPLNLISKLSTLW